MKIDLHIHTRTGSDGAFTVEEVFAEAVKRCIDFISITDHDSISTQEKAISLAAEMIDYNPTTSLEEGLKLTWKWYIDNQDEFLDKKNYFKE